MGVALFVLMSASAAAHTKPPAAYQAAALASGVPTSVLFAVALQESGMQWGGHWIAWPWTLNIAGHATRYARRRDACAALEKALIQIPPTRIDVGLGQLNVGYQGYRVEHPCLLLDPYLNLAIVASILREHYGLAHDWLQATARYHRPAGGEPAAQYRAAVERHLRRIADASATPVRTSP
jgi:hypothetical protein